MKIKNFSILVILLLISFQTKAQNNESTNKIEFNIQPQFSAILVPFEDYPSDRNPDYEIGSNSRIYGLEISASINYKSWFGIGAGIGSETLHLEDEKIEYFPVYLELTPFPPKNPKKGFASFSARIGTHLGNLDKSGSYLRASIGYYIPIINHFSLFLKGIYTHQNLYKTFPMSDRPINSYSFNGIGFAFGVELY